MEWVLYVIKYPPALIIKENPDGTVTYSGSAMEIMISIGQSLNLRYT